MANAFWKQTQNKPVWRYIAAAALDGIVATAAIYSLMRPQHN